MISRFRFVSPAGTPISFADVMSSLGAALMRGDAVERFKVDLRTRIGVQHCEFVSTGRAALTLALLALKALDGGRRNEVVIPSYTCFSVPSSVVKAGLKVRLADVDPVTLDFMPGELERLDGSRVLAVVATNLYGFPNDLSTITKQARDRSIYVVDDAAQCLGGSIGGRPSGAWGDIGLYSFDKGKNVTSIDGGVLVTNSEPVAEALTREMKGLPKSAAAESAAHVAKLLIYAAFLHPSRYWLPNSLPFLGLGTTPYRTDYPLAQYDTWMAPLGHRLFIRLDAVAASRRANAERYQKLLPWGSKLHAIVPRQGAVPAYLRYPVLIHPDYRNAVLAALRANGIGATASYPTAISDVPELSSAISSEDRDTRGGRDVAVRILTLPTHGYVTEQDQIRIAEVVASVLNV
jgi:perosamine synthetase